VSRNTTRARARIDELVDELTIGAAMHMRADGDAIRPTIAAVVAYLVDEYPGQDLYIPACVHYPVDAIRVDLRGGMSVRAICRKHRVGRRTLYRLLDGATAEGLAGA
jgi:hypothetical protein